jgi:hypothetical protein
VATREKVEVTNREFAMADGLFRAACARAGVEPTRRQASKFRRHVGRAWAARTPSLTEKPTPSNS